MEPFVSFQDVSKVYHSGEVEIRALKPSPDFYAFVVYAKGKETSKPSAPFKFSLKREFGMR